MVIAVLDIIVIVVVLLSALLAMVRGFSREVLSVASWAAAAAAAAAVVFYEEPFTPFVQSYVANELIATIAAAAITFVVTLIVVSYVTMRISDFIIDSSIGALDRTLGFLFGVARGLLLVIVAFAFFNWFQPENQPSWVAEAKTKPFIDQMVVGLRELLPADVDELIDIGKDAVGVDPNAPETTNETTPTEQGTTSGIQEEERQRLEELIESNQN